MGLASTPLAVLSLKDGGQSGLASPWHCGPFLILRRLQPIWVSPKEALRLFGVPFVPGLDRQSGGKSPPLIFFERDRRDTLIAALNRYRADLQSWGARVKVPIDPMIEVPAPGT